MFYFNQHEGKKSSLIIPRMKWSLISIDDFQVLSEFGPQNFWLFSQSIRSQEIFHSNIFVTIYYKENMTTKYILKVSWLFEVKQESTIHIYKQHYFFLLFFNFFFFLHFFLFATFSKEVFSLKKIPGVDQWKAGIWSCDLMANERPRKD